LVCDYQHSNAKAEEIVRAILPKSDSHHDGERRILPHNGEMTIFGLEIRKCRSELHAPADSDSTECEVKLRPFSIPAEWMRFHH
jgi:hypothetical protein